MRIEVKTVDPSAMRNPTAGDWEWLPDGALMVRVPEYGNRDSSVLLVAIRQIVEAHLSKTLSPQQQHAIAAAIERECAVATRTDWAQHDQWVTNVGHEIQRIADRGDLRKSLILLEGARHWAELHLFALRNEWKGRLLHEWFVHWASDLPFEGCPCKEHFDQWVNQNPPDYINFFPWTVRLHNAVNERIGKPVIEVDAARKLWKTRTF